MDLYSESNPGGTQIWGDGDPSNGIPPGFDVDILKPGDVITLTNNVETTNRKDVIKFDGGDKLATTKPVAVTRAAWADQSKTLFAVANEVYATDHFGTDFRAPVGENLTTGSPDYSYEMFEYTGFFIMAGCCKGATVEIDKDNDGVFEETITLAEGESYLVDGGVLLGGHVKSDNPIQVEFITGDKGSNFESRSYRLFPTEYWSRSYTTPVSTVATYGTTVWLYNPPGQGSLSVDYITRSGNNLVTNSLSAIASGAVKRQVLPEGTAASFIATDGKPFYAIAAIDSNNSGSGMNQTTDWGFTLIPDDALTPQALVGMGPGWDPTYTGSNPANDSPIWVTTVGNGDRAVDVYVDYDSDPATGELGPDKWGNMYDAVYSVKELEQLKLKNPTGDQTRLLVYTLENNVMLAAAWGQDPSTAPAGSPAIDVGTGIPPFPLFGLYKFASLTVDTDGDGFVSPGDKLEYTILIENTGRQPVTDLVVADIFPEALRYLDWTTDFIDHTNAIHNVADDQVGETLFPLDEGGYEIEMDALPVRSHWYIKYCTEIPSFESLPTGLVSIANFASVNNESSSSTNGVDVAIHGRIGDYVWFDENGNGLQDPGEPGVGGTRAILVDVNGNPVRNNKGYPIETYSDANGYYELVGVPAGEYRVKFIPAGGYTFTTQNSDGLGVNGEKNSTPHPLGGMTDSFTMVGGETRKTLDAGLKLTSLIGDRVWLDVNGDGIQDPLEPGVNGVIVTLCNSDGTPFTKDGQPVQTMTVDHPVTGAAGYYFFSDVAPGEYRVKFQLTGEETFTIMDEDSQGVLGEHNSDADPGTGLTAAFTVGLGDWITSIDAGVLSKIKVTKDSDAGATVEPGQKITYTIEVENTGATAQTNVSIQDELPAGTTFVADSLAVSLSGDAYVTTSVLYTTSTTFTVPDDVTSVTVEAWGGGGGGSRLTSNMSGGGGGGGAYSVGSVAVTSGQTYQLTVGTGASGSDATVSDGGDSLFYIGSPGTPLVRAKGGKSAANNSTVGATGGSAVECVGDNAWNGGSGANGASGGGGGGSSAGRGIAGVSATGNSGATAPEGGGSGGNGRTSSSQGNGSPGVVPGGGGGGAYRSFSSTRNGGAGANGQIILTYAMPTTKVFVNDGAFVVPTGVSQIKVEAWGGGGAGNRGNGGGGGAYTFEKINVTPGQSFTIEVGKGGVATDVSGVRVNGTDSTFSSGQTVLVRAAAGEGGLHGTQGTANTGAGGHADNSIPSVNAFSGGRVAP